LPLQQQRLLMDSKNVLEHAIDSCWGSSSKRCANRKKLAPEAI